MKWQNRDIGAAYYYVTGTFTEWLPLLNNAEVRAIVCEEIARALGECGGVVSAYVLMPTHAHLLAYLPGEQDLHRFCRKWRGRSARRIIDMAKARDSVRVLEILARHANGPSSYAVWKEQPRCLPVYTRKKLYAMVDYIHANPVRKGLVAHPADWEFSSYGFHEGGQVGLLEVTPLLL